MVFCDDDVSTAYFTPECGCDGGDCIELMKKYPNCDVAPLNWIGDCACDEMLNIPECGFDGGDCDDDQVSCIMKTGEKLALKEAALLQLTQKV